jgi:HK97 family phage major capsid protein
MNELEKKLLDLQTELKGHFEKAKAQETEHGTILTATKTAIETLQKQVDAIDVKMAARHAADTPEKTLEETFKENEDISRLMRDHRGRAVIELDSKTAGKLFQRKTTFLSSGAGSLPVTGVLAIDRLPGITLEARQQLSIRDLLTARPTNMQVIDYVKVNAPLVIASPQVEGSSKAENTVTFKSVSERVKTIATFLRASRQILEDFTELLGFLQSSLPYYTDLDEEIQLLSGDSTGENLNGMTTQATAFSAALLSATKGWNKIDVIARTIQQVQAAKEVDPTFVVLHPNDWWDIRLTKDGYGRYLLGDPQIATPPMLWNKSVVPTTTMAAGTFLVGNGNPAAIEIRDRMETTVDISTEDADNFTKNLVTIRCEKRLALIVRRPASFITGTFTSSPA